MFFFSDLQRGSPSLQTLWNILWGPEHIPYHLVVGLTPTQTRETQKERS